MSWSERSKWIWVNNSPIADSYGEFFDTFTYDGGAVTLRISADADYTLYVNGELAAFGQYPDFPHYKVFDKVDVTAFCKAGENTVAIRVWYYGDFGTETLTNFPGKAGVRYELAAEDTLLAFSDKNTASRLSKAYVNGYKKSITAQLGLSYCYDASKEDNWINGKGEDFTDSVELPLDIPLYPRPIKKLTVGDRVPSVCVKSNSGYVLYDLGREEVGYLTFKVQSETPQKLKVCYGEHITDGCVRSEINGRDFSFEIIVPVGTTAFTNYFRRLGLRYLEIHSASDIEIEYLSVLPCTYPLQKMNTVFESPLRQQIYDVSVRTLELCMHDHYEDCPWREQGLYTMDSRNQMLCGYYAFREYAFARASLLLISKDDREDGLLSICAPSNMNLTIPSFSLHYFTAVYEYLQYSGDMTLLDEIFPKLTSIMDVFLSRMQDGLVPAFEEWYHWNFYEWSDGLSGDRGTGGKIVWDAALNMLLSLALQNFQKICNMAGISANYAAVAETVNEKINERFCDPACGLYINTVGSDARSELVNALAVLCGAATGDRAEMICETLAGTHNLTPASLSMVCFKYDALLAVDKKRYAPYVLKNIEGKYKKMLDAGATSFWETELGEADFSNAGSLCHGWSAIPVYYFQLLSNKVL